MPAIYRFLRLVSATDPHNRQGLANRIVTGHYYSYAQLLAITPEELDFYRDTVEMQKRGSVVMYEEFHLEASLGGHDWTRIVNADGEPRIIRPVPGAGPRTDFPTTPEEDQLASATQPSGRGPGD